MERFPFFSFFKVFLRKNKVLGYIYIYIKKFSFIKKVDHLLLIKDYSSSPFGKQVTVLHGEI